MVKSDSPLSLKTNDDTKDRIERQTKIEEAQQDDVLTDDDIKANAKTEQFVRTLSAEDRSKFFAMIGNEEFFKMFKSFASESANDTNQSPSTQFVENNDANDNESVDEDHLYNEYVRSLPARPQRASARNAPVLQNKWGLQITTKTRTDHDLGDVKVILHKNERGNDPFSRKKTRDKVVQALEIKISAGNLSRILTSVDAADFDIAEDAISWQSILHCIRRFVSQYDMTALIMIPQDVNLSNPQEVATAKDFTDAIVNWQNLRDVDYYSWQEFILRHGAAVEIESDNWLEEVLRLSMEKTLCSEVESDLAGIPPNQRGSITTLRCIIKRMVVRNQEAKDALENYIKSFDITTFPGENVPTACLRLKAVSRALGEQNLPSNAVRKILHGFSKSSTASFNDFCNSQIALRRGSFYNRMMQTSSLQSQVNDILTDLEATYLDLIGGNLWAGVNASPAKTVFMAEQDDEIIEARALAAQKKLPFEEWARLFAKCHFCGKKGHIRPDCPDYIAKVKSGEITLPPRKHGARPKPSGNPKFRRDFLKDPKTKAFWAAAFKAMFTDEDDNEEQEEATINDDQARADDDDKGDSTDAEDMRSFLSMVGSLKE
jgi:hypothetical protein